MNFSIKLIDDENAKCHFHGETDEEVYELTLPSAMSEEPIVICSGCLEAMNQLTTFGRQCGMNEFSPTALTITVPEKGRY